jgi:hypothetical protein
VVRRANRPVLVVPSHPEVRTEKLAESAARGGKVSRQMRGRAPVKQKPIESELLTKRYRKRAAHAFPERRRTNKFRESHLGQ